MLPIVLLGGWLLMHPRVEADGTARVDLLIGQWEQREAFDTAAACERARKDYGTREGKRGHGLPRAFQSYFSASRCIPAEALYPPKKCP